MQEIIQKLNRIIELLEGKQFECKSDWWVLKMKPEYTAEYLFEECEKLFKCCSYIDLSKIKSDRSGKYTIEFKPNIEAGEEWKNISANDLPEDEKFITLEERMLLEIQYFKKTGKHLDTDNVTLCAGSRDHDGSVPSADWNDAKFQVINYHPDYAGDDLRSRSAVKS